MSKRKVAVMEKPSCSQHIVERSDLEEGENAEEAFWRDIELDPRFEELLNGMSDPKTYIVNGDFGRKVSTAEKFMESYMREPIWEVPLVGERFFFLNKSHSKWISIGFSPLQNMECMLKLVGVKKQCVCLNVMEWGWLIEEIVRLRERFECKNAVFPTICGMHMRISREVIDGSTAVVKIEKGGEYVYLAYEGLLELLRLKGILKCRLAVLEGMQYNVWYNNVVRSLAESDEEIELTITKMYHGVVSEFVCILRELVTYWPKKLSNDVNYLRMNNGKSCTV